MCRSFSWTKFRKWWWCICHIRRSYIILRAFLRIFISFQTFELVTVKCLFSSSIGTFFSRFSHDRRQNKVLFELKLKIYESKLGGHHCWRWTSPNETSTVIGLERVCGRCIWSFSQSGSLLPKNLTSLLPKTHYSCSTEENVFSGEKIIEIHGIEVEKLVFQCHAYIISKLKQKAVMSAFNWLHFMALRHFWTINSTQY